MDILDEMRRRVDVDETALSDDLLQHFIDVATEGLAGYVPTFNRGGESYAECVCQVAIKLLDTSARAQVGMDAAGEFIAPSPAATDFIIRSVMGIVAPLMPTGMAVVS